MPARTQRKPRTSRKSTRRRPPKGPNAQEVRDAILGIGDAVDKLGAVLQSVVHAKAGLNISAKWELEEDIESIQEEPKQVTEALAKDRAT